MSHAKEDHTHTPRTARPVRVYLDKMSRIGKSMQTGNRVAASRRWRTGDGERLLEGYKVSWGCDEMCWN